MIKSWLGVKESLRMTWVSLRFGNGDRDGVIGSWTVRKAKMGKTRSK